MAGYIGKVKRDKEGVPTSIEVVKDFETQGELVTIQIPEPVVEEKSKGKSQ